VNATAFWDLVERAKAHTADNPEQFAPLLKGLLSTYPPEEIVAFDAFVNLWMGHLNTAGLEEFVGHPDINCFVNHDLTPVSDLCAGIVGHGEQACHTACRDYNAIPKLLTELDGPGSELLWVASEAYQLRTGKSLPIDAPVEIIAGPHAASPCDGVLSAICPDCGGLIGDEADDEDEDDPPRVPHVHLANGEFIGRVEDVTDIHIRPTDADDAGWMRPVIIAKWKTELVSRRGRLVCPAELPGFVAAVSSVFAGLVTYDIVGDSCEIVTLNSIIERRGVATHLLEAVRRVAQEASCRRLWLVTTNDQLPVMTFLQKRGFVMTRVHRRAAEKARRHSLAVPQFGWTGIPVRDEIELELTW
jgi:GNAT superfamily N-acetyltransferase